MSSRRLKSTSSLIYFSLLLLLLTPRLSLSDSDGSDDIDELIAIDEEEDDQTRSAPSSEANVLSRAQRIVIELNNDNTKKIIEQNEVVLLMGYTPWCPRSAELMPQFAEAANLLTELGAPLLMAKVDAERYPRMASYLDIKGYPTLLLFINGTSQPYTGGFTAEDIVIWARKKTGKPVARLSSAAEADAFANKYSMFVVGLFDEFQGQQYEEFVRAATANNEIQFIETNSHEVAKLLFPDIKPTKPFVGLVKSEPEKYTMFEEPFETDRILQFLEYNKFPLVTTLSELNSLKVYASQIKFQLYVFAESEKFKSLLAPLQEVAKKFKSKILFIHVDITDDNLAKPFLTLVGLEESKDIVVAAFDNKISSKYLLESELTPSNIENFCAGLLDGTIPIYYKTQAVPNNDNATVLIVVGKTFDELILRSSKNVVLEVHTPWCMSCETTSKQVEKLAKHYKTFENLVFARIDASANEHPRLPVSEYPALLFYPAGDKSNPIKLPTKSSLKELATLIKKTMNAEEHAAKDEL